MEELVELARVDPRHRLLAREQALGGHLHRDPERGLRGALARSRLQQEELAVLDRELDVLHLAVVVLEPLEGLDEVVVRLRQALVHPVDRLRRADARDDVLSLRVDEELAVQAPLAGRRVAGEADARAGGVALVAEHHLHDVDGRTEVVGDLVRAAVDLRARRLPGVEHGSRRALELLARVLREPRADLALVQRLVRLDQLPEVVGGQLDVLSHAALLLERLQLALEHVGVDPVHDLAVHLDQAAVRVEREPRVPGRRREPFDRDVVQPEVEDRVHHPRHRDRRAGADGDEQRVGRVTEALAGALLEPGDVLVHLGPELLGHLARLHRCAARVRRDRESGGHRDAERGHLREADSLPAEQLAAAGSLLVERIDQAHGRDPTYRAECATGELGRPPRSKPRAELGHPGCRPQAKPDRREDDVKDHHRDPERRPPDHPEPDRDPALLGEVTADATRQRAVPRVAAGHGEATSCRRARSATSRIIRIAVSSTERSETSITGQRSRRWIRVAVSSSSKTASRSA